ncbi:MAG: C69 family dipeptidase [Acidobacteriota bacterium]
MRKYSRGTAWMLIGIVVLQWGPALDACTILGVGRRAMADGTTVITHNDDSSVANYPLRIVPARDWPDGATRKIVANAHTPDGGNVLGEIPQAPHTYRYFMSRYSFMNEKGVAIAESTFGIDTTTDYGKKVREVMWTKGDGLIDCWMAQDVALERAATAREAVRTMGTLVEQFGFLTETGGGGETMTVTDGTETWAAEFYGRDIWAAVRIPDDHVFVAANRARIGVIDLSDTANVMASPKIVSFAVEQGWFDPNAGKPFVVHDIYAPDEPVTSSRREWRVFDLIAPSLKLPPTQARYPFSVKPDKPLTLEDIRKIQADYYEGTPYDMTKGPAAGPWGNPIRYVNRGGKGAFERSINVQRTYYLHVGQVNASLPEPLRGTSWFAYGAPATSYLTPLWPIMDEIPAFLSRGERYGPFDRESGFWTNIYVQQMAELHFNEAITHVRAAREPRLSMLYALTPRVLEFVAQMYAKDPQTAVSLLTQYGSSNAIAWQQDWLRLGDMLLGKYAMGMVDGQTTGYPQWWNDLIGYKPLVR